MSKESDLAVLRDMKQKIISIYGLLDRCNDAQNEYARLQAEKENSTRPALSLPKPNNRITLEKSFADIWYSNHIDNDRTKVFCVLFGVVLMLVYVALLAFDAFRGIGLVSDFETINQSQAADKDIMLISHFCFRLILPILLSVLSAVIFISGRVKAIVILSIITANYLIFVAAMDQTVALLPLIPFVLTLACGIIIPVIRRARAKHPSFSVKQKKELAEAEQQDNRIIEDNKLKNEQADREWAAKRASRLPEIDAEQKKLLQQLIQMRDQLVEANTELENMEGLGQDEKQLDVIDSLIYFIETYRADSIKEALHEYDKMLTNQQLLELQKQRNELEERRIANETADRMKQLQLLQQQEAARAIEARDSATERQQMIDTLRSIEWTQWACAKGIFK